MKIETYIITIDIGNFTAYYSSVPAQGISGAWRAEIEDARKFYSYSAAIETAKKLNPPYENYKITIKAHNIDKKIITDFWDMGP